MDKEIKEKKKAFSGEYLDFYYDIKNELKDMKLNRICYKEILESIIDMLHESQMKGLKTKDALGKDYKKTLEKMTRSLPRKNVIESILDTLFVLMISLSILLPIVYIVNFVSGNGTTAYNKGIEMYFEANTLSDVILVAAIAAATMSIINRVILKNGSKTSMITGLVFSGLFLIVMFFLGAQDAGVMIHINFVITEIILILITLISYFGAFLLYRKDYYKKNKRVSNSSNKENKK